MLRSAFDAMLSLHKRPAVLRRMNRPSDNPPSVTTNLNITPSNYFKQLLGPSATTISERGWVIGLTSIASPFSAPIIKVGDRIEDAQLGNMAINEVIEIFDLGGALMGYHVKCQ